MFHPEMIKAICSGAKTVTRRLSGLKEINKEPDKWGLDGNLGNGSFVFGRFDRHEDTAGKPPYQPGEVVYKELDK